MHLGSGGNAGRFKPDDETYLAGKVFLLFWDQPDFCLDTNRRKVCPSGNVRSFDWCGSSGAFLYWQCQYRNLPELPYRSNEPYKSNCSLMKFGECH